MESRENPVFGRKVFFLNMPYTFTKTVIGKLREEEYEVYVIDDYKDAKNILRKYPNSLCFVNINTTTDNNLSAKQWFNFLKSFSRDEKLKTIYLGVISGFITTSEKEFFLMHASFPAGFNSLNHSDEELIMYITKILELNGAKGRRKYVRTKISADSNVKAIIDFSGEKIKIPVFGISSAGIACTLSSKQKDKFEKNSVINNIKINLGDREIITSAVVFSVKKLSEDLYSLVLLFMKNTPFGTRIFIRKYISGILQKRLLHSIEGIEQDTNTYSEIYEAENETDSEGFLERILDTEYKKGNGQTQRNQKSIPKEYKGTEEDLSMTNFF